MSRLQEVFFASFAFGGLIVTAWITLLFVDKMAGDQVASCEEAAVLLSKERDVLTCPGGKVGHENTSQGILLTCTCPMKEENK